MVRIRKVVEHCEVHGVDAECHESHCDARDVDGVGGGGKGKEEDACWEERGVEAGGVEADFGERVGRVGVSGGEVAGFGEEVLGESDEGLGDKGAEDEREEH